MKALKIVPLFLMLLVLSYLGVAFIEANREPISLAFLGFQTRPIPLGFLLLSCTLMGVVLGVLLCVSEIVLLLFSVRRLQNQLKKNQAFPQSTSVASSQGSGFSFSAPTDYVPPTSDNDR